MPYARCANGSLVSLGFAFCTSERIWDQRQGKGETRPQLTCWWGRLDADYSMSPKISDTDDVMRLWRCVKRPWLTVFI